MKRVILAVAIVALLTATVAVVAGCGLGTSPETGTIVNTADANASAATCATNRALVDQQYSMAQSTSAGAVTYAKVLADSGAKCPSGGSYSFDSATNKTRCSIHGE